MECPITYREYINDQLPKQYIYSDLTEEQKKMAKFVNPECEIINEEVEKLVKRDKNGIIIIEDLKDKQIQMLFEHMTKLTNQLNALTQSSVLNKSIVASEKTIKI